jgi:hypothetical protein
MAGKTSEVDVTREFVEEFSDELAGPSPPHAGAGADEEDGDLLHDARV